MKKIDRKLSLGKGLSALLTSEVNLNTEGRKFEYIEISKITSNKNQPRFSFDKEKLQELAESIKTVGVIEPIIVKKIKNHAEFLFEIIAGERRWRASKMINLSTIPAIIETESEKYELEMSLIENIQRENLNPIEEAKAFKKILEKNFITQESLAKLIGKSRSHISNMIRLLTLPDSIQKKITTREISYSKARTLLSFDSSEQETVFKNLCEGKVFSVRNLEKISQQDKNNKNLPNVSRETNIKNMKLLIDTTEILKNFFQLKINIDIPKMGTPGKIEIFYESEEDLFSILEKVNFSLEFNNNTDVTTTGDFFKL